MKTIDVITKLLVALAAVAGAVYVVATYGEQIVAWAKKALDLLPKGKYCRCSETPEKAEEAPAEEAPAEEAPAEEAPVEEAPVEEAPAEEAPAETEEAPAEAEDAAVVADEADFVQPEA